MAHNVTVNESITRASCDCGWWCSATFGPVLRSMLSRHSRDVAAQGGTVWLTLPARPMAVRPDRLHVA